MAAQEYEFSSDAVRVQYAEDKVRQYGRMVDLEPTGTFQWEHMNREKSLQETRNSTPAEAKQLASNAAFHLSQELNSIGIIYRGIPTQKEQEHE